MGLNLRYAARSDVGLVRADNEDSGYAGSRMLVVADGMGGHASGELASSAAVATFAGLDLDTELAPDADVLGLLAAAIDEAHDHIGDVAAGSPSSRGMGTTVTALAWLGDRVGVAHIGDSRAYLMRAGRLMQLTRDHTYVQTLVDSGRITAEEAITHERRNLLTKALDGVHPVESDLSIREVVVGDRFLLCTDGLHGVVPEADLAAALSSTADPTGVVDVLVAMALENGAPDNVTALVADVVDFPDADATLERTPIVVGAAAEHRNRSRLPGVSFPDDSQPMAGSPTEIPSYPNPPRSNGTPDLTDPAERPTGAGPRHAADAGKPSRRSRVALAVGIAAMILLILGAMAAWAWTRTQFYVGVDGGYVTVFQGIPQGWGQHGWSTVEERSNVEVAALPEFAREQVQANISAEDATDALRIVTTLGEQVALCATLPTPAGCPTPVTPTAPSATPAPAPGASNAANPAAPSPAVPSPVAAP